MEPSTILRSDALDILFENRNKQYGAYALRRNYPKRLLLALSGMAVLVVTSVFILLQPKSPVKLAGPFITIDDFRIEPPPPLVETTPPPPQATAPAPRPAARTQFVKPEIVPDNVQTDPLPEINSLSDKIISTFSEDGPPSDNITQPPVTQNNGTGAAPIPAPAEEPEIRETAAIMPSFPGGLNALQRWLSRNLRPQEGIEPGQRIKVVARFVVDVNGKITGVKLTQSGGDPFDQEVLRVINKMPQWNPGKENGKSVSVWFNIPIIFTSQDE